VISKVHNGTFRQTEVADTYTLRVGNVGPGSTTGAVTVTDTLPAGLSPTTGNVGTINGWTVSVNGQTVTATRTDVLASGASFPALTITVKVAKNAPASVTNTAIVSGGGELNTANDTGTDVTPILPPPTVIGQSLCHDVNGNGLQDRGEPGVAGITVHLFSTTGQILATAVTDAAGHYSFSNGSGTSTPSALFNLAAVGPNSHYTVKMDNPADMTGRGPLAHMGLTSAFVGLDPGVYSSARLIRGVPTIDVRTGPAGAASGMFNAGFVDPRGPGILTKRRFIH
jgi:uncharacterized repeat protein (TIGR01451 family)